MPGFWCMKGREREGKRRGRDMEGGREREGGMDRECEGTGKWKGKGHGK